jgi:hypothetical protein
MRIWTPDEVEKARIYFLDGKRLKTIANELGRSVTAVNKLLSRAGIRPKNSPRRKTKQKLKEIVPIVRKIWDPIERNHDDFRDVIFYIRKKGYNLGVNNLFQKIFFENAEYVLNGKPISKIKLLLFANKLRIEEKQPIFNIPEITYGDYV